MNWRFKPATDIYVYVLLRTYFLQDFLEIIILVFHGITCIQRVIFYELILYICFINHILVSLYILYMLCSIIKHILIIKNKDELSTGNIV